jgi:hypothetical protein
MRQPGSDGQCGAQAIEDGAHQEHLPDFRFYWQRGQMGACKGTEMASKEGIKRRHQRKASEKGVGNQEFMKRTWEPVGMGQRTVSTFITLGSNKEAVVWEPTDNG